MGKTFRNTPYGITREGINPNRFNEQGTNGPQVCISRRAAIAAAKACGQRRALKLKQQQMPELLVPACPEDDIYMMS